jgi:hypothetical protein
MKPETRIVELEPGWLLITFVGQKPPHHTRAYWLRRALSDWSMENEKPIVRAQPVQHGELIGLMAWTNRPEKRKVPYKVHRDLKVPREHLEALMQHALDIYFRESTGQNLAVVTRGGVAALVNGDAVRFLPFDQLRLPDKVRSDYATWQQTSAAQYFVMRLPTNLPLP